VASVSFRGILRLLRSDDCLDRTAILGKELSVFCKAHLWLIRREDGQTMAEYAVVLGVITLAVVGVFTALSGGISSAITNVTGNI
jgi:Flp pilus assembly pilin Flp